MALDMLGRDLPALGGDPNKVWISGWSAGAHLAVMALDHPIVRGGLAVSGLYDLEPIRHSYVNDALGLDGDAAWRNSPIRRLPARGPSLAIVVGATELPLMRQQSAQFAEARQARGLPGSFEEIAGANHFSILEHLARPGGRLVQKMRELTAG
jgi:acetyl esterase/lipase